MEDVYISGHKNPDTDSVCSAYCYAELKRRISPGFRYLPIKCGATNSQTRFAFQKAGIEPPQFVKDILPRVADVMTSDVVTIDVDAPVFLAMKRLEDAHIRSIPVVSEGGGYRGSIGILELAHFFLHGVQNTRASDRMVYPSNFRNVIPGVEVRRGEAGLIEARVLTGDIGLDEFERMVASHGASGTVLVSRFDSDILRHALRLPLASIIATDCPKEIPEMEQAVFSASGSAWFFASHISTADTLDLLNLCVPVSRIMNTAMVSAGASDYLDSAREKLLQSEQRSLPILEDGILKGIVSRSDVIKKVRKKLIMMDHNEVTQALEGADSAEIIEIIDHHRLGSIKTNTPIFVYAKPVGSTCTLVYELFRQNGIVPDAGIATLLLSGILSDTVILKSPTTTDSDRATAGELATITGLAIDAYGIEMFSSTESLAAMNPDTVVNSDMKIYDEFGVKVGIGQVEVVTLANLEQAVPAIVESLLKACKINSLDWSVLMVTDIISESSVLITTGAESFDRYLSYRKNSIGGFDMPGVLSRKKQLLPEILRTLEERDRALPD